LIPAGEQSGLLTHSAASPYHLLRNYRTFEATDFQLVTIGIFKEKRVVAGTLKLVETSPLFG